MSHHSEKEPGYRLHRYLHSLRRLPSIGHWRKLLGIRALLVLVVPVLVVLFL